MTTQIEIIEKKIEELKQEVERLKTPVKPVYQHPLLWEPEAGDTYYVSPSDIRVYNSYSWDANIFDASRKQNGNMWQTKELAERYGILGHATVYLREVARYNSNPDGTFWVPDWSKDDNPKYFMYFDFGDRILKQSGRHKTKFCHDLFYFKDMHFTPSEKATDSLKKHLGVL